MVIATIEEVEAFLSDFHQKLKIQDAIIYVNERDKNTQTLADLELSRNDLRKHIERLSLSNYSGCQRVNQCMEVRQCGFLEKLSKVMKFI